MQKQLLPEAEGYARDNLRRRIWRRFVRVMACIVVFCTTYALILPAITMEKEYVCAMAEHKHTDSCYTQITSREIVHLACSYETLGVHTHTNDCRSADGGLQCGSADYIVHEHDESCWEDGALVCALPEVRVHKHTDACFELPAPEVQEEPHEHTDACKETKLICELSTEPHIHGETCYTQLECELPEGEDHAHTDACIGSVLTCQLAEQPHEHVEGCYETNYICGLSEEPEETEPTEPQEPVLICGKEEIQLHTHSESCYEGGSDAKRLICGQLEVLSHDHCDQCLAAETVNVDVETLTCQQTEGHTHSAQANCFNEAGELVCEQEETEGHAHTARCYGTWELVCTIEEHVHTETCYEEEASGCELEEHLHAPECFDAEGTVICGKEEHTHTEECAQSPAEETEPAAEEVPITMLSYTGDDYEVVLRFGETAGIPANAELEVVELSGEAYREHLERTYSAVGDRAEHTLIQFGDEGGEADATMLSGSIGFARFFDLTIYADGVEIQPKDTVEVTIRYDESVVIPEGEKTAVHFAHDGSVEILNAESVEAMALTPIPGSVQTQEVNAQEPQGETFVFRQSSFSVTGTISLGSDDMVYNQTTSVDWFCGETTIKTLTVYAQYGNEDNESDTEKSITIKVPTGFRIVSYSATDANDPLTEIDGVTKVVIDNEFKGYVLTSDLKPASLQGKIVGVTDVKNWVDQKMTGYTGYYSTEETDVRTYGGDIEYALHDDTQTVRVVVSLQISQELLSHTMQNGKEEMEPIQIITASDATTHTTSIQVTATEVPRVYVKRGLGDGGMEHYFASEFSETAGRSNILPISAAIGNMLGSTGEDRSYFEKATFTLTYPAGVFLESDTVYCTLLGYSAVNTIPNLVKNTTVDVVPGHLSVRWMENGEGGGTITWLVTKGLMYHSGNAPIIGAEFRANNDDHAGQAYHAGDTIDFTVALSEYERNGHTMVGSTLSYHRTLIADGEDKDIRLMPKNYVRRDITADFKTDAYDYGIGGYDVFSALAYENNTFYFENANGLKITALNLMGEDPRNIKVITNTDRLLTVDRLTILSDDRAYGSRYHGTLLRLSEIGGKADEYIKACLFTVDFAQTTYSADHEFGAFVYIGQFQDGNNDGSREGDVILQQLDDGTSLEQFYIQQNDSEQDTNTYEEAISYEKLKELTMINAGNDPNFGGKPIVATDHTTIGWTNTGVGAAASSVVNAESEMAEAVYYPNTTLKFSASIHSGYNFRTQDMLINPTLVISLPEGLSLKTTTVYATSAAGASAGEKVYLNQVGSVKYTTVDGVTWSTYRFRADNMLDLVAEERLLTSSDNRPRLMISASFEAIVDSTCKQYDLSLQDVIMWDVRNTAYEEDTLTKINKTGENGDAVDSQWNKQCTRTDVNNFLGYNNPDYPDNAKYQYGVANNGETFVIKPLIGLNVDLGIKPVAEEKEETTYDGYTTYNGTQDSIVHITPGEYADVKLTYLSTSNAEYFKGSAFYVPVPKKGEDYSRYFENIELSDPMSKENNKTFEFTMDLTGPVTLKSAGSATVWKTYYALKHVASNPEPHKIVPDGEMDEWEPVVQYNEAVVSDVNWLEEKDVTNWADVAMMKFVAQDNISPDESGTAIMRLYVHDVNSDDGPALGNKYNYWRGYGKAITSEKDENDVDRLIGNWKYTSVVAATPAKETLVGQIFIDNNQNGLFDTDDRDYTSQIYTAVLSKDDGSISNRSLAVNGDGYFALVDQNGEQEYLTAGAYTVTIRRNADPNFHFANTVYSGSIGEESPEGEWHNNVASEDDISATWHFTVTNEGADGTVIHRVGIGLKPMVRVEIRGVKTFLGGALKAGAFTFLLEPVEDAPVAQTRHRNSANGTFSFGTIWYEKAGKYTYRITEDYSKPNPGIIYDFHTTTVTVSVTEDPNTGILTATAIYDNSESEWPEDQLITDKAAFTNSVGYELPETGGAGTTRYTMGGLLLMAAAVILLYMQKRKFRKGARPSF